MRTVLAVVAFAAVAGAVVAQQPGVPPPPVPLPPGQVLSNPIPLNGGEPAILPGGKDVSQPLQPVGPAPVEPQATNRLQEPLPPAVEVKPVKPEPVRGPLGPSWDDLQLLYWWPTPQPVPALAYGTRTGLPPVPGRDGTQLLVGGHAFDSQPSAGARFVQGYSLNNAETFGFEVVYFFLGTRTFRQTTRDFTGGNTANFGLPYTNATTGAHEILPLAQPGVSHSYLNASTSVRVQGWEINSVANVLDGKYAKINALLGWRYFMVNEGLRIEQTQFRVADASVIRTADQFDAHNRFNGGQLGLHADLRRGVVFCEMTAKIAFGRTYEVVKEAGATIFQPGGIYGPVTRAIGGSGIYVQPSNFGRTANGVFAVVPEGTFKFGFRLGDTGRVYVGYNFIYLSDAVRPGDQVDRALTPAQIPLVNGGTVFGSDRPARLFNRSDFWTQGLIIGLETRY